MSHPRPALDAIKLARIRDELADVGAEIFINRRLSTTDFPDKLLSHLNLAPTLSERNIRRGKTSSFRKDPTWTKIHQETLEGIAAGLNNRQIAAKRFVSEETTKTHVRNMLVILNANNRSHMVSIGYQLGYLKLPVGIDE